jgi:hypothetical protein
MLLCEVALGDMNAIKEAAYMEKAPEGTHSTKGIGQRGPDFSKSIVLPSGVGIPMGQVITYPVDPKEQYNHYNYYRLQHNEYAPLYAFCGYLLFFLSIYLFVCLFIYLFV